MIELISKQIHLKGVLLYVGLILHNELIEFGFDELVDILFLDLLFLRIEERTISHAHDRLLFLGVVISQMHLC
jgi:hypothetical protein